MSRFLLAAGLALFPSLNLLADEPCMVLVDTGTFLTERHEYLERIVKELGLEDHAPSRWVSNLKKPATYPFVEADGDRPVTGLVYTVERGRIIRFRFRLVSDPEAFDVFVKSQMERRGSNAIVSGARSQKKITVPSPPKIPGKPTISWSDFYTAYHDGVIVWGSSPKVFTIGSRTLTRIARKARGRDSFIWLRPANVPVDLRKAYLATIERATGVSLQQRDDERPASYWMRRSLQEAAVLLVKSFFFEIEEMTGQFDWPRNGNPSKARLEVVPREKSALERTFGELNHRPEFGSVPEEKKRFAELHLSVAAPTALKRLGDKLVTPKSVEAHFEARVSERAGASATIHTDDDFANAIWKTITDTKSNEGSIRREIELEGFEGLETLITREGSEVMVEVGNRKSGESWLVRGQRSSPKTVLFGSLDAAKLVSADQTLADPDRLATKIERICDHWLGSVLGNGVLVKKGLLSSFGESFHPLSGFLLDKKATTSIKVTSSRRGLVVNVSCDEPLFKVAYARYLLTRWRAFRQLSGG